MRTVAQTLELALSLLDKNPSNNEFLCCHLEWMGVQGHITTEEECEALVAIKEAIGRHVTLAGYLRETGAMPQHAAVLSPEYRHYQLTFYRGLISKLQSIKE